MQAIRINILLFFAVTMFAAKPFIGFSTFHLIANSTQVSILAKAFTKRKQEFVEDSDFDIIAIQKRLADPILFTLIALSFFLSSFFKQVQTGCTSITGKILDDLHYKLFPPEQLYLLTGKLSI